MAKQSTDVTSSDEQKLLQVLASVRNKTNDLMTKYSDRYEEIDTLEDEIIENYINNDDLHIRGTADHIQAQNVFSNSMRSLSRVAEIYSISTRNITKLSAVRNMFHNSILPILTGGSADTRTAKANDLTQSLTYLIELETGLSNLCETAMKNIRTAQDMASRTLKSIELDLIHFGGAETLSKIVTKSKNKYFQFTEED